jgi:hypothetical protein
MSFRCDNNRLTSLEGAPLSIANDFNCDNNQLTSLEGAPQNVVKDFNCDNNQLTSLEGAPRSVGGDFYCSNNQLTSLEGAPQSVGGGLYCSNNPVSDKTLNMIFKQMVKGDGYLVALSVLRNKIPAEDWGKLQKPDDVDFDNIAKASEFGII